ncbi:MAG: DUF4097 family beta strand repeat-containing protein [Actinomycetota bacterium]
MLCEDCGKEARPGDVFCRQCGARLAGGEGPAAAEGTGDGTAASAETAWEPGEGEAAAAGAGETAWEPVVEGPVGEEAGPAAEAEAPEAGTAPEGAAAAFVPPPAAPAMPPPPYPPPLAPRPAPARTSGWAVASLVLGILSFMCLPFIAAALAIVFGAIARSGIKRSRGEMGGSGLATAGIVLGIVNLALLLIFVAAMVPWMIINIGDTETVERSVSLQGAQSVSAELEIDSGNLNVGGGADLMFEGTFTYNIRRWEPEIDYSVKQGVGELSVRQGGDWWVPAFWFIHNDWDLRFADSVPLDLGATLSSGDGEFDLRPLALRSLKVDASSGDIAVDLSGDKPELRRVEIDSSSGDVSVELKGRYSTYIEMDVENSSGEIDVDLLGEWVSALGATITNSSGDVTLRLPRDVGVRVRARTRSGDINAPGMTVDSEDGEGAVYVNDAFRRSIITLQIDVEVSSGDITLLLEE